MRNKKAFNWLKIWANQYEKENLGNVAISFDSKQDIGFGESICWLDGTKRIIIGTGENLSSFRLGIKQIKDYDFIRMGVTLYHEIAHHRTGLTGNAENSVLFSDIAKQGNGAWYRQNWQAFPHEINAEYNGVMNMWTRMEEIDPAAADNLMLEYLTKRAGNTVYMFKLPKNGLHSKEQVRQLFDEAYVRSVNSPILFPHDFLRLNDEIPRLFTSEYGVLRIEYQPFYKQLAAAKTGNELNLKMASLVSYVHPELQKIYPAVDFKDLNPSNIFGLEIPEPLDKIHIRLNINTENDAVSHTIERSMNMTKKEKEKELLKMPDRALIDRILAFPDREYLNRDEDGKRRKYPSAEMAVNARRNMEKDPDWKISDKQRWAMAHSFAEYSSNELKVAGIKSVKVDPEVLVKNPVSKEGVKAVYNMHFHLVPEPENEYDKNAVAVYVDTEPEFKKEGTPDRVKIGYVPASYADIHPITDAIDVKGTLTDHSNGHFKTISYAMDMDTEAIGRQFASQNALDTYTYRMPVILNGNAKESAADYLNSQTWPGTGGQKESWADRLNNELEFYGVNGHIKDMKFEFPGGKAGSIILETEAPLNPEAMGACGSWLRYSLETRISSELYREKLVDCPQNLPAVNLRDKTYLSLQSEPETLAVLKVLDSEETIKVTESTGTVVNTMRLVVEKDGAVQFDKKFWQDMDYVPNKLTGKTDLPARDELIDQVKEEFDAGAVVYGQDTQKEADDFSKAVAGIAEGQGQAL